MSFQQGLSGLNASAKQLDVIGNNVANSSTVGFKQGQAQFADMYAASLSGSGAAAVGTGVKMAAVMPQFTQGNITNTSNPLDTAISGQGFFRMIDQNGSIFYSRNGQCQVDKNGYMVNSQGHQLSGYLPDVDGNIIPGQTLPIQINASDLPPQQTENVVMAANLDSRAATPANPVFNTNDPTTYTSSTSLTVYDSLGASHVGALYFQRLPVAATAGPAVGPIAGSTSITLADATGMAIGNTLTIGGAVAGTYLTTTITAIAGNTVTFSPALTAAAANNAVVTSNAGSKSWNTYLSVDGVLVPQSTTASAAVPAGGSVTLTGVPTGLEVGDTIVIAGAGPNGGPHTATVTVLPVAPATNITFLPATTTALAAAGAIVTFPMATLTFDTLGKLDSTTPASTPLGTMVSASFTPTGAEAETISFDFADTAQYGAQFGVNSLTQDGYAPGRLSGFSTGADGTILGRYTNGQSRALGQMLLANFTNPQGLQPMGNNEWVETSTSGAPLIGTPGSASLGILQSSATEDSNVDLTAELVNMITAQRVYQANAQTVKTQDAIMQTLVNMR